LDRDRNTPEWVQHIALRVGSLDELLAAKESLEVANIDVLGPTHHGIFKSIYFFDPNGHRLELAANINTPEQMTQLKDVAPAMLAEWSETKKAVAPAMLAEWSETKKAPRHAAWLHEKIQNES